MMVIGDAIAAVSIYWTGLWVGTGVGAAVSLVFWWYFYRQQAAQFCDADFLEDETKLTERLKNWKSCDSSTMTIHLILMVPGFLAPHDGAEKLRLALLRHAERNNSNNHNNNLTGIQHVVVHRCTSNLGLKSKDGVLVCGKRLAVEVNALLEDISKRCTNYNINNNNIQLTISLLGNSMGGLIARAALPDIQWHQQFKVIPNVFCTSNTPHVGCVDETHFDLPPNVKSIMIKLLVWLFGQAGEDLFRCNDTLTRLASEPRYLDPLAKFTKRIAYSNAFKTDFQVTTPTGVFVAKNSTSVHYCIPNFEQNFPLVDLAVYTPRLVKENDSKKNDKNNNSIHDTQGGHDDDDDDKTWMQIHCQRLDALGWTKVFCDPRPVLAFIPVPTWFFENFLERLQYASSCATTTVAQPSRCGANSSNSNKAVIKPDICSKSTKEEWTASELYQYYFKGTSTANTLATSSSPSMRRIIFPFAHKVLLANSARIPGASYWTNKGLPFVEEFSKRIVEDVVSWSEHIK